MLRTLLKEVANRRLLAAAGGYMASMLLVLRLADRLGPALEAPEGFQTPLALVLALGFPVFLAVAWRTGALQQGGSGGIEIPLGADDLGIPVPTGSRRPGHSDGSEPVAQGDAAPVSIPAASIAVLPFRNYSSDEAFIHFAAGMHEDVLTFLSRVPGLLVISRTSVMRYRDGDHSIPEIAKTLQVAHVLEGSVRRAGDRVRITVQLIRADGDAHLWAENYDRELTDVFAIQEEVAEAVARTLSTKLSLDGATSDDNLPTEDTRAYDCFVHGRELIRLPAAGSARDGLAQFERAVELDPNYAQAYAGIAMALRELTSFDLVWEDVKPRAIENARRAIALDPKSSYAEYVMGVVLTGIGQDNVSAEAHLKRAIELNPNCADSYLAYSENLYLQSRYEESFVQINEAARRNPLCPRVQLDQGRLLLLAGKRAEALEHISRAIDLNPDSASAHLVAGRAYDGGNELLMALGHYGQARVLDPTNSEAPGAIAGTLTRLNLLPAARAWLEEQRRMAPAGDEWFFRQSQLLTAEGLHDALDSLAADWERYNASTQRTVQLKATAASLKGFAARKAGHDAATRYCEQSVELLKEFLSGFATPDGYRAQFNNIWNLLSLGLQLRILGDESGTRHFQAVIDLYEDQPEGVQLPNQRSHLMLAHAALGDRDKALENMRLSLETADYTYWVFPTFDFEVDASGLYHGITEDPEFQKILAAIRDDAALKQQRVSQAFPAILDPTHADWENRGAIANSARVMAR